MDSTQLDSFQRWKEAREQLDHALLHFHKTTSDLDATISERAVDTDLFENIAAEVDQDSCSVAMRIEHLKAIRVTLKKIRNRSTSLVPINKLPEEVVLHILRFAVQGPHDSPYDYSQSPHIHQTSNRALFALTHACTRWRSLVINTTSFWSKIYLNYDSSPDFLTTCDRVQTYLERAHGRPLDIEFHGGSIFSRREIAGITTRLRRHLKYVKFLRLIDFRYPNVILDLVTSLLTHGQPGSIRTLVIWYKYGLSSSARIHPTNSALTQQRIDASLLPIQSLFLGGMYFDWDSSVYHNLVRLQLAGLRSDKSPTIRQIMGILSACPELETLQLQNLHILADKESSIQPVVLNKLTHLDLVGVTPEGLSLLLPMIVSPSQELSTRIDLHPNTDKAGRTVRSFLSRTSTTRLYIPRAIGSNRITEYLSAVPNLNVLILDLNSQPGDDVLTATMRSSQTMAKPTPVCPGLHTLYLINGSLRNETVQVAVEAHPLLKKLRFISCFLKPFDEELLYWLKPFVKDAECKTRLGSSMVCWYRDMT